jgi:RNA polymerase sigma factor (sigma-70 family)
VAGYAPNLRAAGVDRVSQNLPSHAFNDQQRRFTRMPLDADAISRLYEAHAPAMLGFFMRRTYEPEAAVDLVAETFAAAFEDRARFRGIGEQELLAWLYAIARHRAADFRRRGLVERRALARLGFQRRPLTDQEYERVEQLAGLESIRRQLTIGLQGLGAPQREVLQLRILEERPYSEVARALGVSEQTARARVSRALRALRELPALSSAVELDD